MNKKNEKKKKHGTLSERWPRNYVYFLSASVNQKPEYKAPVVYASLKILTQIEILEVHKSQNRND